jgi:hypothetical protein
VIFIAGGALAEDPQLGSVRVVFQVLFFFSNTRICFRLKILMFLVAPLFTLPINLSYANATIRS